MRRPGYSVLAAIVFAAAGVGGQTPAQAPFSFDLRLAAAAPTSKLADVSLGAGAGMGATIGVRVRPHIHAYAGWDWMHFHAAESFAGLDRSFEATGFAFGARYQRPFAGDDGGSLAYRLEAGATLARVDIQDGSGNSVTTSDHRLGGEFGAGLAFDHGPGWRITPMLRFRAFSPEFAIGSVTTPANLRYLALELGIRRRF